MEDRDGKKPFIIPKTHTSTKDVCISEKPDSRNITELFDDIKSCALESQFDFRQNEYKSCDTIRNQKLQKLYNEKRIKMKKDQDPVERLAFHLITYRDVALNVANDGLRCEQLSLPIDKYLGNPKDGVHLSRRPDVLLTSSGAQGLYRFGLLVCKVLLGKGYATIPSTNNNQLPAQLHYDHHFCKIQSINKEQRHIDDLLANSLIFCYEHENFETISHPPQILPIAILWYDLTDKFSPELISTTTIKNTSNQESQHRNGKITNKRQSVKKKTSSISTKPIISPSISHPGTWEGPNQDPTTPETPQSFNAIESSTVTKYPSHFMVPFHRVYSNPLAVLTSTPEQQQQPPQISPLPHQILSSRDPRLLRAKRESLLTSSETIPLSPQHSMPERSLSDGSKPTKTSFDEPLLITKSSSVIYIPLISSTSLIDPRLKTLKQTRNIFYLELQAVKHALQQQKRLNHYHDPKSGLPPKTSYTLVPFLPRQVSNDEYERLLNDDNNTFKFTKHSNGIDYSSLYILVDDCFNFGLLKPTKSKQMYVDLEQYENKLAYEQIEISNELVQREKQLNSQQIRLRLREKRQRKMQQQINDKKIYDKQTFKPSLTSPLSSTSLTNSKLHIATGRQLLKEHEISSPSSHTHISTDLLDFFSREYKNETRPHVKHLLAELVGVFIEKYQDQHNPMGANNGERKHSFVQEPIVDDQTINSVIDMDLDSPSSQGLCDHDERFRIPTPPPLPPPLILPPLPPTNETMFPHAVSSLLVTRTLSNEPNKIFDDPNYTDRCQKLLEQLKEHRQKEIILSKAHLIPKIESMIPSEETVLKVCFGQFQSSSSENSPIDDHHPLTMNVNLPQEDDNNILPLIQDDSNRSRDEFVKLLTKEAYVSKSSSPAKIPNDHKRPYNYHNHRRRSFDENDNDNDKKNSSSSSNTHRRYSRPSNNKTRRIKSPNKKLSSTRTVTLVSNRSTILNENQDVEQNIDISTDNQNDSQIEPTVKRIRVEPLSPSPNTTDEVENPNDMDQKDLGLKSVVTVPTIIDEHDYRREIKEKRRATNTNPIVSPINLSKPHSSRSRSRSRSKSKDHHRQRQQSSTNSHSSSTRSSKPTSESTKKSKQHSPPSSISSRTSSHSNHHRHEQKQSRNEHQHGRRRSSDLSNRHQSQYSNQISDRHELFNEAPYRNLASTYHQRNINDLMLPSNLHHLQQRQPVRHKRFNYNHQSVADHPRFANQNVLLSPTPLMDFNYPTSPTHHRSASPVIIGDRNVNSSYYQNKYIDQSKSPIRNYSNCSDSKQSETIERLQILLQNETNELKTDYSVKETVNDNSHWSSSSSYSSIKKSDTIVPNNKQTFTCDDSKKLLNMVHRFCN